jgi:hypothetical protein
MSWCNYQYLYLVFQKPWVQNSAQDIYNNVTRSSSRCLVMASNGGLSSASRQGDDHLTPASCSDRWLHDNSFNCQLPGCQPQTSVINFLLAFELNSQRTIDSFCSVVRDRTENIISNSFSISVCARCLAMALVLLRSCTAIA